MTPIGYLSFLLGAIVFWGRMDVAVAILVLSSTWAGATIIDIGGLTLWPFELLAGCFVLKMFFLKAHSACLNMGQIKKKRTLAIIFFIFGLVMILLSLLGPHLFEGMLVMTPRLGIDDQLILKTPLSIGGSNYAQALYWSAHVILIVSCSYFFPGGYAGSVLKGVRLGLLFFLGISIWQASSAMLGIWFPYNFFLNGSYSYGYGVLILGDERLVSTLPEASVFSAYMAAAVAFWICDWCIRGRWLSVFCFAMGMGLLLRSLSSTGFLGSIVCILLMMFIFIRRRCIDYRLVVALLGCGLVVAYLVVYFRGRGYDFIYNLILEKPFTTSGVDRKEADIFSWQIFKNSYGVGVGFGSHRASSLVATVLACGGALGLLGFGLFLVFLVKRIWRLRPGESLSFSLASVMVIYLFVASIAVPDANTAIFWCFAALFFATMGEATDDFILPISRLRGIKVVEGNV